MGNCMSWMKKKKEPGRKITLAILGLDNAGKTVTAKSLSGEKPADVAPTIGFQDVNFKVGKTQITMFDLGGGKNIRDIWYNYLAEVYGIVYVVDSSEGHRLSESRHVLNNLVEDPRVGGKPLLLLANKQDVKGALDEIDVCEKLRIEDMVNMYKLPCKVETCSAVQGFGKKIDPAIKNGLQWLVDNIHKDWDTLNVRVEKDTEEQREKDKKDRDRKREKARRIREEREEKEKEQRRRRGLPSESESEDDDMDLKNGDPFKRYSKSELAKKEAKEKERKRRLKQWDEEDTYRKPRGRYGSDSDEDNRPHLNRRKNRFSDDDGSKSARNYRSDDEINKKGGLSKLSFRRSLEDLSVKKRSPMLNRRNNRSRSPSPDLTSSKRNFSSLNNRKSRSRSPSPTSRFGGRDSYSNPRTAAPGRLAPLRNSRTLHNDYDSDKEPWQKNRLSSSKRFDDSDDERTPRSRDRYSSRNNDSDEELTPRRMTRGRLRSSRGDSDDDDDDRFKSSYGRSSDRFGSKGRKTGDDSDSDPLRVSFSSDPFAKKGRSPRPSSPTIQSSLSPRKSRDPLSSNYELAPLPRRNLTPLAPIAPLEPISKTGKKKKKNRFASRNKTAPSPYDDDIADSDHTSGSDRQTYGTPRGLSTPPQLRSSFRASRSPRLAPMEEQENELDSHSTFSRKWGLDLPEPADGGYGYRSSHRYRPNVDSEDDLIT